MNKLLNILKEKGITFYQSEKYNMDSFYFETYQDEGVLFEKAGVFETDNSQGKSVRIESTIKSSHFKYFLDGSRKTYKIADAEIDNKFMPVVAGQIGAGVCERTNKKIKRHKLKRKNLLMLYNGIQQDDFKELKEKIEDPQNKSAKITVERYEHNSNSEIMPENKAIAKIQKQMYEMEIDLLEEMTKEKTLAPDKMLMIDGSLQFSDIRDERYFYNVIGISKNFNPNLKNMLKNKYQSIGTVLPKLDFMERTPVFKYNQTGENKKFRQTIGAWYLRVRPKCHVKNPLDGIVKIEKIAVTVKEKEDGFDTGVINNISHSVLLERNVTCHGKDNRWAGHLYPIYLTETMLKNSFLSDVYFLNIF